MAHGLETIDWSAPWLATCKGLAELAATQATDQTPVYEILNRLGGTPVLFVPQSELSDEIAYESYIFKNKQCPTRDGLHDFFNGLCWHQFPQTKARLNQLQAEQIDLLGTVTTRGPVRDALTVFDENAAFLFAPPELWQALVNKDWQRLFVTLRPLWTQAQLVLFGHALLEKLTKPRKSIVAHVYIANIAPLNIANLSKITTNDIDAWIANDLNADYLASKPFTPLPVQGVPNWCSDNESLDFYNDETVFRKPRP